MPQEIHYEVFRRHGVRDGGWTLREVVSDRESAIRLAEAMMKEDKATGVKVVKETYHSDTGDYLSLKIYEDGHTRMKVQPAAEDMPHALPCSRAEDFYAAPARATLARLLPDFLAQNRWTPTELIHRGDALEKLEATGTLYQHAIQKLAVAQAASTGMPVAQIIKNLNELATMAVHRVYRDERRNHFPDVARDALPGFAAGLCEDSEGSYLLNGVIVRSLKPATGWNEKLETLLGLVDGESPEDKAGTLIVAAVDAIAAEMINCPAALHELIGKRENLGDALLAIVLLFSGEAAKGVQSSIAGLAGHFRADRLGVTRSAIASRILAEFRSVRRLTHVSIMEELRTLRRIASTLVSAPAKYLDPDALIAAFTLRSSRLVTHGAVAELLADAKEADEKIERLLLIEENIVGAENKRRLSTFIMPILTSNQFDSQFLSAKTPALPRLQRLAELQGRIRRSALPDKERGDIADVLDRFASEIEQRGRVLDSLEARSTGHVECALALLKLCAAGVLTEGRLSSRARAMVLKHLAQPGFLTAYATLATGRSGTRPDADGAMAQLMDQLAKAGIAREAGLRAIAA